LPVGSGHGAAEHFFPASKFETHRGLDARQRFLGRIWQESNGVEPDAEGGAVFRVARCERAGLAVVPAPVADRAAPQMVCQRRVKRNVFSSSRNFRPWEELTRWYTTLRRATRLIGPVDPPEVCARVRSLIRLKRSTDELDSAEAVIMSLARTVEARHPCTEGHCQRLSRLGAALGTRLGLGAEDIAALTRGGVLHDLGKIGISDAVLLKPGILTAAEYLADRQRPRIRGAPPGGPPGAGATASWSRSSS
jgi:hypothetical protein